MQITTDRLILREYLLEDFDTVFEYAKDPDFSKYQEWGPSSAQETKDFLAKSIANSKVNPRTEYGFAATLRETDQQIGGCDLRLSKDNKSIADFGYAINPRFQKKGYATEATQALIDFGFNELKLSLIYATCDVLNIASYTVMEKLGMKRVSIIRNDMVIDGRNRDSYRYEIKSSSNNA